MMKKKSMNHVVVYWLWALTLGSGSLLGAGVAFAEQGQATTLNGEGAVTVDSSTMTVETQAQGDAGSGATGETGDTDSSSGGDSGGNTVSGTLSDYVPQEEPIPQHEAVVPTETEEGEAASRASQLASQTLEIKDTNGRQTTYLASFDAKGYTGVKDVQFPVWSSQDGKDDLVWYKGAYNSKSQKWEARIDISKHKSPGNFQVHVYVQTANGAKELAAASSFEVTPPTITGQIDETGKANGTYTVKLQVSSVSGVSSLRMPIWSKANQSDIKWYDAVLQPDGSYQVVMDYKNHAYNGGAYNNHVYLTAGNGLTTAVALNKVTLAEPTLAGTLAIKDTNGKETTFTASFDTKNYPGVKSVQIPVWSADNGQDDLIWYSATYNSSTKKWEAKIDIANHKSSGVYNAHVYVNLTNGQKKAGGAGTFAITAPSVTGQIDETNKSKGQYTITLKPTSVSGVSSIRVPVWSKANQSDLKWYDAVRQSNGSYKVTVDYKNHSYNGGNYNNHVYLTASNGVQTAIALNKVTLQEPSFEGTLGIKDTNGKQTTYQATFDASSLPGVTAVQIPVWSNQNGQDDIVWYAGTYNAKTKKWEVTIDIKKHKSPGVYHAHVYATLKNGQKKAVTTGSFSVTQPTISGEINEANLSKGQYTITLKPTSVSGVSAVRVPVWSKANQSDLKWYDAVRQSDGSYKVTVGYKNHNYNWGSYNTHVYLTAGNGVTAAIALKKVELAEPTLAGSLEVKDTNGKQTTYLVAYDAMSYPNIKSVQIPVWSSESGQDDIVWYNATYNTKSKKWETTIDISKHKSPGTYNVHVYVTLANGQKKLSTAGKFEVTPPTLTGQLNESNKSKGQFSATFKVSSPSGVKSLRVPIWSKANQSDLKWYDAKKQADGSYRVDFDYENHGFNTGSYTVHAYLTAGNGLQTGIVLGAVGIQMDWPQRVRFTQAGYIYKDKGLTSKVRAVAKNAVLVVQGVVFTSNGKQVYKVADGYISASETSYVSLNAMQYVAHRGNHARAPENSLPAFEQVTYWGSETDIQLTKDHKWVIMHDSTVDRMTNGSGAIKNMTLEQIRRLRIDTGNNVSGYASSQLVVPTLEEYLGITTRSNKTPVIEIKTDEITAADYDQLVSIMKKYGMENSARVISFYHAPLKEMKKRLPNLRVMYLTYEINQVTVNQALDLGSNTGLNILYNSGTFNAQNIAWAQSLGISVGAWTVPSSQFGKMQEMGVDYVTTDQ